MTVFVIADMASAHDGDLTKAKALVDVAVAAGCDAIKVQYWSDADALADRRQVPQVYRDIYHCYQLPTAWLAVLHEYCGTRIEFMATCFLPQDVPVIAPFVQRFKVSAFEHYANDLFEAIETARGIAAKPVIVSVNPDRALNDWIRRRGDVVLHCISAYPSFLDCQGLHRISELRSGLNTDADANRIHVGLSDHSGHLLTGAIAVGAGATYLEVHVQLPTTDPLNPDSGTFALLPSFLTAYVQNVRLAQLLMSVNVMRLVENQAAMLPYRVQT